MIGIYKITNKINNKIYIGQSWDIEERWRQEKRGKCNDHLKSSLNKYGKENFIFEILVCFNDTEETQMLMDTAEDFYIKQFETMNNKKGYNKKGGGNNGRISKELKEKISNTLKGRYSGENSPHFGKRGKDNINFGKKRSEEFRKKMSELNKGKKHSVETKLKMSESRKKYLNDMSNRECLKYWKGKYPSEETRKKLSEKTKLFWKNEDNRKKRSEAIRNGWIKNRNQSHEMTEETKKKRSEAKKGKLHSEEHKNKIREAVKEYWKNKRLEKALVVNE